jgi:hypothetical protein
MICTGRAGYVSARALFDSDGNATALARRFRNSRRCMTISQRSAIFQ